MYVLQKPSTNVYNSERGLFKKSNGMHNKINENIHFGFFRVQFMLFIITLMYLPLLGHHDLSLFCECSASSIVLATNSLNC